VNFSPLPDSTFAWDQYWRDGRLASCGGEGGVNYQPAIAEGWRRFFDTVAEGAHILDICTGNGAVARLAAETARTRNLKVTIDAVDSAMIQPTGLGALEGMIRFLPRTPAENLPFPDDSFDVIVGQYALEYTDVERTLAELRRVSRPDARIRFVTHAAGSVVVEGAKRQIEDTERLTGTGIFEAAEALARLIGDGADAPSLEDARRRFGNALQALQVAARSTEDVQMYRNVGTVLLHAIQHQHQVGARVVLEKIAETASAIGAHRARLSAMRNAALDESGAQAVAALAERLWTRKFDWESLARSDGSRFGWVVSSG
jgi:ubiquinone/menaquinone biosynthesis C-methylase UbiE